MISLPRWLATAARRLGAAASVPMYSLAREEERAAAAHAGRGLRPADQHAQALARLVVRERDRLEALAAHLRDGGVARGALGRGSRRAARRGALRRRGAASPLRRARRSPAPPAAVVAGQREHHATPTPSSTSVASEPDRPRDGAAHAAARRCGAGAARRAGGSPRRPLPARAARAAVTAAPRRPDAPRAPSPVLHRSRDVAERPDGVNLEERLVQQEGVEPDDQRGDDARPAPWWRAG